MSTSTAQAEYIPPASTVLQINRDDKGRFLPGNVIDGHPAIYSDPEELRKAGEEYFKQCSDTGEPATVIGLALHLGFTCRESLTRYMHRSIGGKCPFFRTIKTLKAKVEQQRVSGMLTGKSHVIGSIFLLKNDHNYKDKQEIEQSITTTDTPGSFSPEEAENLKDLARHMIENRERGEGE